MLSLRSCQGGVSLVEIVIGLAIGSTLLTMGVIGFSGWTQNAQIRAEAESIQNGLQLGRIKAVQSNTPVRFQLTTSLDNGCELSPEGTHWVVSQDNPAGLCGSQASDVNPPRIIQVGGAAVDGATHAAVAAIPAGLLVFIGTGRAQGNATMTVNISNPDAGDCRAEGGNVRCLRIMVSAGGRIRMCDPALSTSDPGGCQP